MDENRSQLYRINMVVSGSILFANFAGDVSKWEFNEMGALMNPSPVTSMTAGY